MVRIWNVVSEYSLLLIIGAVVALFWANVDPIHYREFQHLVLIDDFFIGHAHVASDGTMHRTLTLHFLVNDLLMAFFFAIAGKEIWEAVVLKGGSLRGVQAVTPLIATFGGMIGPILIYVGVATYFGSTTYNAIVEGWAIPTATDIAFSSLVGRFIFGAGHPAVSFLLLLAIADDALGLIILAIFYPTAELAPWWLMLSFGAAVAVFYLFNYLPIRLDEDDPRKPFSTWVRARLGVWPYVVAGSVSWYAFQQSGIHPALGLLPIVMTIPHAERDFGLFSEHESTLKDLLNSMEHSLKHFVEVILFFFGLLNAGVQLGAVGEATYAVVFGLVIGKPLGIFIFGYIGAHVLKFGLSTGMRNADLFVLGCVAAIGFTVSLFVTSVAFSGGSIQDAAKMGAVLSFIAAPLALVLAIVLRVQKVS